MTGRSGAKAPGILDPRTYVILVSEAPTNGKPASSVRQVVGLIGQCSSNIQVVGKRLWHPGHLQLKSG